MEKNCLDKEKNEGKYLGKEKEDFNSPGKAPLGNTGDSLYQNVSGAPADPKQNGPSAPESEGNVMYENMPFHRQGPYRPDSSDEMVYADLYDDVKAGKVPDPRMKPPLPPKGIGKKPKEPPLPPKTKKGGLFDSLGI
ncbi:vascular cell adhesion protein 1, putative [Caerostris darwini]|uniref:Vascular cell adhesion protein 1, putative n=1 Tax=Caerostris darwini TaxID=1538125 RepID=A0AAV4R173_9ARAC|nr:vascular cell adhesion protein 1, putative [Caerostris darwini]